MTLWRVEIRKGRKARERVPRRHLRLIARTAVDNLPACGNTYQGIANIDMLRCRLPPRHGGQHEGDGLAWSRCNGATHGEPGT